MIKFWRLGAFWMSVGTSVGGLAVKCWEMRWYLGSIALGLVAAVCAGIGCCYGDPIAPVREARGAGRTEVDDDA